MHFVIHYENLPIPCNKQRTVSATKIKSSIVKNDIFNMFAQNIECGYTLELPRGSNEYPQSMFWIKNKKNSYTPEYPLVSLYTIGIQGDIYCYDLA